MEMMPVVGLTQAVIITKSTRQAMTEPSSNDTDDERSGLSQVESAMAALQKAMEGHTDWLSDLEREVITGAKTSADISAGLVAHSEWLETLERWVSSCVRTLANFGAQPLDSASPSASMAPDITSSVMARLEVSTVMSWIADAAAVDVGPTVSVTIATRDRPRLLRRAIDSVLNQSYPRLELVVVNDSDESETDRLLAEIDDPRLRVVRTPARRGPGAAYNVGLGASIGDVIAFLDDDNIMHRDWLRSIVWAFSSFPEVHALYGARINEDAGAQAGVRSGMLPSLEFVRYDRRRHERANFIDRNTMAFRSHYRDVLYNESLKAAFDWDHSLRLFAKTPPLALPVVSCYYRTVLPGRVSDDPEQPGSVRLVRARAHTSRPLKVHVHTEMFPVISETYIGEDIAALEASGAIVTVSALEDAVSRAENAPVCRLDVDAAIEEAQPDVVLMHWATHADVNLPLMERHNTPFACRVHTFDVDRDLVSHLLAHPLCVAVFAHPHHLSLLPDGVQPLIPTVGAQTIIPESTSPRDLVLSVSAGLPKKDFPFLVDVMSELPEFERKIILARSNGVLDLPQEVVELAAARDPTIDVMVNVPRSQTIAEIARASVLVYTLAPTSTMGFPMSIVEAMLCGTIVIAPDRSEAHSIVGDELRTYHDGADIVRHVREVAKEGPRLEASREALRQRARRHREPAELQRLHDALRDGLTAWKLRPT